MIDLIEATIKNAVDNRININLKEKNKKEKITANNHSNADNNSKIVKENK